MESSSKWWNLPSDILLLISQKLDGNHDRQLRAVCTCWNSALPKSPSSFPLQIPCPIIPTPEDKEQVLSFSKRFTFYAVQRSVLLISPLRKEPGTSAAAWIAKVEETGVKEHSVFNPLTGNRISPCSCNRYPDNNVNTPLLLPKYVNLLHFCVTDITKAYTVLWVDKKYCYHTHSCSPAELSEYLGIKKIVSFHYHYGLLEGELGILVLLALRADGKLAYWKSGIQEWKMVNSLQPHNSKLVDIMCFDAKFCAVDMEGNLIMIDPLTVKPIKSVAKPYEGVVDNVETYLVQCEEYLYLVKILDFVYEHDDEGTPIGSCIQMLCFVLLDNGWVANDLLYGAWPKSHVIFLGNDVTYSLSAKHFDGNSYDGLAYHGGTLDFVCPGKKMDLFVNMWSKESWSYILAEDYGENAGVYQYNWAGTLEAFTYYRRKRTSARTKMFWPPPDWERQVAIFNT